MEVFGISSLSASSSLIATGIVDAEKSADEVLATYLRGQSSVSNLIGTRMHPVRLPQSATYPAVSYRISGLDAPNDLDGACASATTSVEIKIFANHYSQCYAVAEAIRLSIQGLSKRLPGKNFFSVIAGVEKDGWIPPKDASNKAIFSIQQTYHVLHGQSVPEF